MLFSTQPQRILTFLWTFRKEKHKHIFWPFLNSLFQSVAQKAHSRLGCLNVDVYRSQTQTAGLL